MKQPIQEEFDKFALACFRDISAQQYVDLRRTFFAGAITLWTTIFKTMSEGDEVTPEDLAMVSLVHEEMRQFNKSVKKGEK